MGWIDDKAAEAQQRYQTLVTSLLAPGETLLGVCQATHSSAFSNKLYVIGVTPDRLILVPIDRKIAAKGPAVTIRREDITTSSVDGFGGGLRLFLTTELGEIRLETATDKYKLMILGGGLDQVFTGSDQRDGKSLFLEFLASARGIH